MDVRVWGVVEERLIEVVVEPDPSGGIRIVGLPEDRSRTTADRVRAALTNAGLVSPAPSFSIRLEPSLSAGPTSELDLPLALAALAHVGVLGAGLRWVMAAGRLGLDGAVYTEGLGERISLADVVESVCQTHVVASEHMFEDDEG